MTVHEKIARLERLRAAHERSVSTDELLIIVSRADNLEALDAAIAALKREERAADGGADENGAW
ncbi:MAG: hypothetical protein LUF68_01750, partial [Clostridiales bacterium]|nr:hypothetical protein [Clostridiales bacterium]